MKKGFFAVLATVVLIMFSVFSVPVFAGGSDSDNPPSPPVAEDIYQLWLNPGWNFVSTPVTPTDASIDSIFSGCLNRINIIWGYDNVTKQWLRYKPDARNNTLKEMVAGKGYWVYSSSEYTFGVNFFGEKETRPTHLYPGWNLAGYNSYNGCSWAKGVLDSQLADKWVIAWNWNGGQWYGLSARGGSEMFWSFNPGQAYWIKLKDGREGDWAPERSIRQLSVINDYQPDSAILIAGKNSTHVARFIFNASGQGFTVEDIKVKVLNDFATHTLGVVTIKYTDKNGELCSYSEVVALGPQKDTVVSPYRLSSYILTNSSANIDVYLGQVYDISGVSIAVALDHASIKAVGDNGTVITSVGEVDLTGNIFTIRKSKPTFVKFDAGDDPTARLYRFSVMADNAGDIDIKQLGFFLDYGNCDISQVYLYDPATATRLTAPIDPIFENGVSRMKLLIGTAADNKVLTIAAGTIKELEVRGTVIGFNRASGDIINVGFLPDDSSVANADAASIIVGRANNVWSDRSTSGHSTKTKDWTNGYQLKDMAQSQSF